jgi:hypothetical protein
MAVDLEELFALFEPRSVVAMADALRQAAEKATSEPV